MHPTKRTMVWINVLGGIAVLASYAHGVWSNPATRTGLWGGVPEALRPLYTVSMLLAAAGYLAFTGFLLFRVDPRAARVGTRFHLDLFNVLYVVILVPSALWMPLTFAMLDHPSPGLWLGIRLTLAAVGVGSVGLLVTLLRLQPRQPRLGYGLAVAGSVAFCFQTAVLDALIWPAFFSV